MTKTPASLRSDPWPICFTTLADLVRNHWPISAEYATLGDELARIDGITGIPYVNAGAARQANLTVNRPVVNFFYHNETSFCYSSAAGERMAENGDNDWRRETLSAGGTLSKLDSASSIATRLAAIIGIIIALFQMTQLVRSATSTLDAVKLQALDKVVGILQADSQMQKHQSEYLAKSIARSQTKLIEEALKKNVSGNQFYWSDEARPFTEIAEHYERLGAILRLKYLEFDIIFQIIPFPDNFWKDTAELRRKIRENWRGPSQSLPDLFENFRWLCKTYEKERTRRGYSSAKGMRCDL